MLPLLLPDSPVAIWWPADAPDDPAADPLGALAQRRITDAAATTRGKTKAMETQCASYAPGNTDLAWTRITLWRALLASALDQHQVKVTGASVAAERISPSADLLATWLGDRLRVDVERTNSSGPGITEVVLDTRAGPIRIERRDGKLATFSSPGAARPSGRAEAPGRARAARRGPATSRRGRGVRRDGAAPRARKPGPQSDRRMSSPRIEVHDDAAALASAVAGALVSRLAAAQAEGSSPTSP